MLCFQICLEGRAVQTKANWSSSELSLSSLQIEEMETVAALLGGSECNQSRVLYPNKHVHTFTKKDEVSSLFSLPHTCFCFNHCFDQQKSRAWTLLVDESAGNDVNPEHGIDYRNHAATKLLVYMSAATHSGKK